MAAGDARHTTARAAILGSNATANRLIGCNADGMLYTHPYANFGITADLTLNDSDKSFTVPANLLWIVHWIMVEMITTATPGNRRMLVDVHDSTANRIGRLSGPSDIPASNTRYLTWAPLGQVFNDANTDSSLSLMPAPLILPSAFSLRVYDLDAIAISADDMEVTIGRQEIDNT